MYNGSSNSNSKKENPVDKFEEAFMGCIYSLTKEEDSSEQDSHETRFDVDQSLNVIYESGKVMEGYFLKKRHEIGEIKPELIVKDDTSELRHELLRKDELLKRNCEKLTYWQSILADLQSATAVKQGNEGPAVGNPVGVNPLSAGVSTTQAQSTSQSSQGSGGGGSSTHSPATPRPATPGSVGRSPGGPGGGGTPSGQNRMHSPANVGFASPNPTTTGLQGPLAYLEKTASTIATKGQKSKKPRSRPSKKMTNNVPNKEEVSNDKKKNKNKK